MKQKVDWNFNWDSEEMVVHAWEWDLTSRDGEQLARILTRADSPNVGTIEVWDLTHNNNIINPVKTTQFESPDSRHWHGLFFSTDGKKLALHGNSIIISDLTSDPVQQRSISEKAGFPSHHISKVTFSHDDNQLMSINFGGMITL